MNEKLNELIRKRKIVKNDFTTKLVSNELKEAEYDLKRAKNSLKEKDFKWSIVKAYYSMFHSTRALLFSKGFREKSHRALIEALFELFVKTDVMEEKFISILIETMEMREAADYRYVYSEIIAEEAVKNAKIFLKKVKEILGEKYENKNK